MVKVVIAAFVGLAIGFLIARLQNWKKLRDKLPELLRTAMAALWRLLAVLLSVGAWAALLVVVVHIGRHDDHQKDIWSLVAAAVFLLGLSLLLYATGARQRTAKERIELGGGEPTRVAANDELSEVQYGRLPRLEVEKLRSRYKATDAFQISLDPLKFSQGDPVDARTYRALSTANQDKFARAYRTKQRFALVDGNVKPSGSVLTDEEYGSLPAADKRKVDVIYTPSEDFEVPQAIEVSDGLVDTPVVAAHLDAVKQNATLVHIVERDVEVPAEDTRVIEEGAPVDGTAWRDLTPEQRTLVSTQRGLFFRGLFTGSDGRWSTSKLQVILWTYAVLFALTALYAYAGLLDQKLDLGSGPTQGFGDIELQEQYLLLLGGPFAAAVVAKLSTQSKVASGNIVKSSDPDPSGAIDGLRQIISNDAGQTDVMDFQYFMFNVLALLVFAVSFIGAIAKGMPELPWFLVGLTSTSALAYATKKSIERSTPLITRVEPERVRPGEKLSIEGHALVAANRRPPRISIAGRPATDVEVTSGTAAHDVNTVALTVPSTTKPNEQVRVVVAPEGSTTSVDTRIDVIGPTIDQVQPTTIPAVPGTEVLVFGEGFGDNPPSEENIKATLGSIPLTADEAEWSDTRIAFKVGSVSGIGAQRSGPSELRVTIKGRGSTAAAVTLAAFASTIETVVPTTIQLSSATPVTVVGHGFGGASGGEVRLGDWLLTGVTWRDELITGTLPAVEPVPDGYDQAKKVPLTVIPTDRPPLAKDVAVIK
jgi:hypothetical protein